MITDRVDACILISAGAEWRSLLPFFPDAEIIPTPYGDTFHAVIAGQSVRFLHGGWGKVAAAGSTQYAIDRWSPKRIINLGSSGGFTGQVERGALILVERTVIYDIIEQMSDPEAAIEHYSVDFDLDWLPSPPPQPILRKTLVSADRDIIADDIPGLIEKYDAAAADWESGAIAWVAKRNGLPCLILRGVSDLVNETEAEAYGDYAFFEEQCREIMSDLIEHLPAWLEAFC
ncbi:MAG: 5'-methylthioadenosine/S-adenosylhomocysteine nucleosidase [Anaerolineaceae bacterium]|nr:5'-methylthioadenosine/S-adenosylhomocysteine nucleosidase [Anaerolineaceae bacterium]